LENKAWRENSALAKEANLRYGTSASKLKMAQNRADQLAAVYGDVLVPAILKVVDVFRPLIDFFQNLNPEVKKIIIGLGVFIGILGPLTILLGAFVASIGVIAGVFGVAVAPIIAVVAAITALIAAVALLADNWDDVTEAFNNFWNRVKEGIENLKNLIPDLFKDLKYMMPDFLKKKLGMEVTTSPRDLNDTSGLSETSKRLLGVDNKSETVIGIKVSSDNGTSAKVDGVKRKSGDSIVSVATVGYMGAGI